MSKQTLSVFFNIDRTYVSIVEPKEKGLELLYINSTDTNIDLENIDDEMSQMAIEELTTLLQGLDFDVSNITVTIPSESVIVSQFPGRQGMSEEEMRKLIALEIKHSYPQFNPSDFSSNIVPMETQINGQSMMLAVIIPKQIVYSCLEILNVFNLPIESIEISQLNAHTAFLYNYPEFQDKTVAILGVQENFVDISVIQNSKPIFYDLVSLPDKKQIGEMFETQYNRLISDVVNKIDMAYFFGTGLTRDMHIAAWEISALLNIGFGRLNAFRMLTTNLEPRDRDYCLRTQHIYPPCIGGSFPAYHESIKLY
jgi:Tfp pilus assembly PilM family ATPase